MASSKIKLILLQFLSLTILQQLTSNGYQVFAQNTQRKVIIVGAGLAGYSAAAKLIENGIDDIIILEAENRIGGRVHSVPFDDSSIIDMGAQWLHGQQGNLIYEMIDGHFDFGDSSFDDAIQVYHQSNGVAIDQNLVNALANLSETIISNVYTQTPTYLGSFGSFFTANYLRGLRTSVFNTIPWSMAMQVQHYFHTVTNDYYGSESWFDISIAEYSTHGYTLGSQWVTWRDEGFSTVFDFISRRRPDPTQALDIDSKIELNKEVTNIRWEDDIATVTCSDNTQYSAEYIIFTASLGVLKDRHKTLFTPRLPDANVFAIENIDYGSLEKFFLEFTAPFWDTNIQFAQYSILWTQEDIAALVGTDREWLIDMTYFRRVDAFPNVLGTFFIGARFPNLEFLTEQRIIDDCFWLLQRVLPQQVVLRPIRAIRSEWMTNTNFLGAYSLFTMNAAHHRVSPSSLAETVRNANGHPRIFFAGEATSTLFSGYSNGAVETGFRAGEEVSEYASSSKIVSSSSMLLLIVMSLVAFFNIYEF